MSENDLDEMNIEIMRNKLYKASSCNIVVMFGDFQSVSEEEVSIINPVAWIKKQKYGEIKQAV